MQAQRTRPTSTELEYIRKNPGRFTWGLICKIHEIGSDITIVQYRPDAVSQDCYHVYVRGEDTCNSSNTFDGALLLGLARKNIEPNEARYMALAASKLLRVQED